MGTLKFSLHMLKKEYKKSLVYTLTLSLTIAVTFLFFNIIDNVYLMGQTQAREDPFAASFSSLLSFTIIVFCAFIIFFANNFYISRKTKEIAIMTMSGSSFLNMTAYLFYQNVVMTLIAFPIGIGIGYLSSITVNRYIYQYLSYQVPLLYVPLRALGDTMICIVAIIFAQLIYASGYVYRKDISYLLSQENRTIMQDERIVYLPNWLYFFTYILGIIILLGFPYTPETAILACSVGSLGIGGILKYCGASIFQTIKRKRYMKDSLKLVSLSHLYYSLRRTVLLIEIYGVSTTVMVALMISQRENPFEMITVIIGFIVVMILLLASLVFKCSMEAYTRKTVYHNLYKLGYTYRQLIRIIKQEVVFFYILVIGMPFIYILLTIVLSYLNHMITLEFLLIIIGSQVVAGVIAFVLTYVSYKKSVLTSIKEGMNYEQ